MCPSLAVVEAARDAAHSVSSNSETRWPSLLTAAGLVVLLSRATAVMPVSRNAVSIALLFLTASIA